MSLVVLFYPFFILGIATRFSIVLCRTFSHVYLQVMEKSLVIPCHVSYMCFLYTRVFELPR
jgi:hypothetical protein